jgi:divalent metal cation (Fe/Co/Zn/Cd) transporter
MRRSVETNSSSLKADAWHHRAMQLLLLQLYWNFCCSIVRKMSLQMIGQHSLLQDLYQCLSYFRPALEIMDEHVHDDLIEKIRATSNQVEGIIDTENASSVKLE